jgi:hypothetical protein
MTDTPHSFADLAGRWRGSGEGSYPTIEPFAYVEELTVEAVPNRPIAHVRSRTIDAATSEPRHSESGFLRSTPAGVELVLAHSFGIVEMGSGSFAGGVLVLASDALTGTASAKSVDRVERRYELSGTSLTCTVAMAAVGVPLTHHLRAVLERQPD